MHPRQMLRELVKGYAKHAMVAPTSATICSVSNSTAVSTSALDVAAMSFGTALRVPGDLPAPKSLADPLPSPTWATRVGHQLERAPHAAPAKRIGVTVVVFNNGVGRREENTSTSTRAASRP